MTIYIHTYTATLKPASGGSYTLDVGAGSATLDEGVSPYVALTLTISTPIESTLALIDPRLNPRVTVVAAATDVSGVLPYTTRTFDVLITDRTIDHNAGTTSLVLACDEALLHSYALVSSTADVTALAYQASVRKIVDHVVLSKIGAHLKENRLGNPSGRGSTSGYVVNGTGTMGQDPGVDTYFAATASAGSGTSGLQIQALIVGTDLAPSTTYTFSASVFGNVTAAGVFAAGSGVASGGTFNSTGSVAGSFVRCATTFTTGVSGTVSVYVLNAAAIVSGNIIAFQDAQVERGTIPTSYQSVFPDANFTTLTTVENLIANPSAEADAVNWIAGTTCTIARVTTQHFVGTASIAATSSGASPAWFPFPTMTSTVSAEPGLPYTFSVQLRSTVARGCFIALRFYDSTGAQIGSDSSSSIVTSSTTAWTGYTLTATAPALTVGVIGYIRGTGSSSGDVFYSDAVMLTQTNGFDTDGVTPLAYFDGATTDTALYNYTWSGTANESASTRTPVFERDPSALTWQPGQSAYDFISTVLQASALRLFCDEKRTWRLVDNTFAVDGLIVIAQGFNLYTATDTISRTATAVDGSPLWFDSIVIKYSWNDQNNVPQIRYDVASVGSPTQTYLLEKDNTVYPGPGAASYWLNRVTGQGRTLAVTSALDFSATPGQSVSATVPFTDLQTGYLSSVSWDFSSDDMTVGTRGLIDTPPKAWSLAVGTWAAQTATWATY